MPNDKAKFYQRSYCDQDLDGYSISGDYANDENINDRNKLTYASTTESSDGTSEDIIIDLVYNRSIDTIVLKSNLKTFTIYYWNGSSYSALETYASNDKGFILLEVDEISTSSIKITATHTIIADEEKKIYMLELTKKITEMYIQDIDIKKVWESTNLKNIYGGAVQVIKYPNHGKVDISLSWKSLKYNEFIAYDTLKNYVLTDSFAIYLYFSDEFTLLNEEAYYLVSDLSDYDHKPSSAAITTGIDGEMELLEV